METTRKRLIVFAVLGMAAGMASVGLAKPRVYQTAIALSAGDAGAATKLYWSFKATGSEYEKVDEIEIDLPAGMKLVPGAFAKKCVLVEFDSDGGEVCAQKYPGSKIGQGKITTSAFGRHTVAGEAYLVDAKNTPGNSNVMFFFPSGQVFGAGAQTLFSTMNLKAGEPPRFFMKNIQGQLSLPFGMSAKLIDGDFSIVGQGGELPYTAPGTGDASSWEFGTKLVWAGNTESQSLRASVR